MTFHTVRTRPAKGYTPVYKTKTRPRGTKAIMVRLEPEDFKTLRTIAIDRGTPLAAVVREAMSGWLRRYRVRLKE